MTVKAHSLLHLGDQYASATSEAQRARLLAAGEAIVAADMWNSSGAYMSGMLLQGAGVIISVIMLRSRDFSKVTAYAGLLLYRQNLAHGPSSLGLGRDPACSRTPPGTAAEQDFWQAAGKRTGSIARAGCR